MILVIGCLSFYGCSTTEVSETTINADFTTYTDEASLFSISYPSDWEPNLSVIQEAEQVAKDIIQSINSDTPIEQASLIFTAGVPSGISLNPNLNIVVEPLPETAWTHDAIVEAEMLGVKAVFQDYHEFSRVNTTIDNRTATIVVWQGAYSQIGTNRYVTMISLVGNTAWVVTCTTSLHEYSQWEDDLDAIVRSLRILK